MPTRPRVLIKDGNIMVRETPYRKYILEELRALHATGVMGISREELLARVKERAGARERTPRRMRRRPQPPIFGELTAKERSAASTEYERGALAMPSTDTDLMVGDIQGRSLPDQPPNSTALMDEPSAPEIAEEPSGHDEMWIYRTPLLMFMFMLSQMARIWFYLKTKATAVKHVA
ncbi:hypothetical protein FOMPIDRAFT_91076 [Fomitopsis schrenkii]|uniref:Uncharacterized protein n=1 Tax=Fomitopsis schrenkii TaxID=2126942 RepID=S8E5N9_FOMSC|nr:hypothetical protein FOMPIDRAFT_91076 [Fomitopsis schrenkii]